MKFKSLLASVAIAMLLVPTAFASFEPVSPDEYVSDNTGIVIDAALNSSLKEKLMPLLEKGFLGTSDLTNLPDNESKKIHAILDPILAGERAYLSVELSKDGLNEMPTVVFSIKNSDSQWADLSGDTTASLYNNYTVYNDEQNNIAMTRIGQFAVLAQKADQLKPIIDRANANGLGSLNQVESYNAIKNSFLQNRIFGIAIDYSKFGALIKDIPNEQIPGTSLESGTVLKNIFDFIRWEGISVAQTSTGYALSAKVTANSTLLSQWGLSLSPTQNFTPHLFESMPNAKPIMYVGANNLKAEFAWEKKMVSKLFGMNESDVVNFYNMAGLKEMTNAIGVSYEDFANVMTQEYGLAVQSNDSSSLPYITLMADVSNNRAEAQQLVQKIINSNGLNSLKSNKKAGVTVTKNGDMANITIKLKDQKDIALLGQYMTFTLGVSTDNKLILSNYPNVMAPESRTGFAQDSDFAAYPQAKTNIQSLMYFNARGVWNWLDGVYVRMANAGSKDFPSLEKMQEYYKTLQVLYGFKDIMISTSSAVSDAQVNAWVAVDDQKHESFGDYIKNLKASDKDDDGISDYEELFLYHTSVMNGDCDKDGISDNEALSDGFDPCAHQAPVFGDIGAGRVQPGNTSSQPYYLDEVVALKQAGVVSGYPDGTFGPGKNITRAEFLAMVMKGFPKSSFSFGGFHNTPFGDVKGDEWFATQVADAYSSGIVAGSYDKNDNLVFRPSDPITRAEALMILSKASKVLKGSSEESCSISPFSDVPTDAWFCSAVKVGKKNRITSGKAAGKFVPNDKLTRGEAAVMIRRTMELDVQNFDSTSSDVSPFDSLFNF